MSREVLLFLSVFLASSVEGVEAVTIVLAAGLTTGWRSALSGVAVALLVLAGIVAGLGPALTALPIDVLRLVVGGLLLVFGLQWLRKAILRSSGFKELHDEEAIFEHELEAARAAGSASRQAGWAINPYGFTVSFKGVLLEGLEVAFIAVTFGSNQHDVPLAAIAAVTAVIVVVAAGVAVRAPLSRVPENTLKYAVGVMLTSFGMFWGAEGAGASWPGGDASIPALIAFTLLLSWGLVFGLRRRRARLSAVGARTVAAGAR
ncbi:MAG: COG4280 domain-containing protein [Solirubrobacteraceae bacterium]|nr:MAG: hypothetical protein DLM63_11120 [Solirubrobacterales bacterium]